MSELLGQLYAALAFLLPGFVALHAGYHIYGLQPRMSDLEKSTWSLFLSLGVLGFYLLATGKRLTGIARDPGALVTPASLFSLLLIVGLTTFLVILWLYLEPLRWLNTRFWKGRGGWQTSQSPLEVYLDAALDQALVVETATCRYYGRLTGFGWLDGDQSVRLAVQHTIEWNEDTHQETLHPYVADMLIPYNQVVSLGRVPATQPVL